MRVKTGRKWVTDAKGTAEPQVHPPDVRMPYISNRISALTGERYAHPDKDGCHIDDRPSELGQHRDADVEDRSRHGGIGHLWNSHPPARTTRYERNDGLLGQRHWVKDKSHPSGYRLIDLQNITTEHDCDNHLPL